MNKQKEITSSDLHTIISEVTIEVLREQRDEIIRRAHAKLRAERKQDEKTEE